MASYGNLFRLNDMVNDDPNVFQLRDGVGFLPIRYASDEAGIKSKRGKQTTGIEKVRKEGESDD